MFEWPPNLGLFFGIVTFLAASVAVRSWRELGLLVLLTVLLAPALKWLGAAVGWAALAAPIVISEPLAKGWHFSIEPTPALIGAVILASLLIIARKEIAARRAPPRD
jgi:hypothetical protein